MAIRVSYDTLLTNIEAYQCIRRRLEPRQAKAAKKEAKTEALLRSAKDAKTAEVSLLSDIACNAREFV